MAAGFRGNISVVILNYDRPDTTAKSVECVQQSNGDFVREIIVVDNGSPEASVDALEKAIDGAARLIRVGTNRYFGEGNNIGVEEAEADFILLLNNDAFVEPDCIPELVKTMQQTPGVAAVGPMFLYPNGSVQEVGGIALTSGDVTQIGKGAIWGPDHYTEQYAVDYCSAACLLMRRADFMAVGGFSFRWEPAYYEDVDLCLSLAQRFGSVLVNPRARVVHMESLTTGDPRMRLETQVDINKRVFMEKWGEFLRRRQDLLSLDGVGAPPAGAESPKLSGVSGHAVRDADIRRRPDGIKTAVVFSPYELVPGGGERYIFEVASALNEALGSDNVRMGSTHRYSALRLRQMSDAFGVSAAGGFCTVEQLKDAPPDLTVVMGNEVVPPIAGYGRRYNVYMCQFPFGAADEYIRSNMASIPTFDEIWVNSNFTRRYVNGHLRLLGVPAPKIRVISPPSTLPAALDAPDWRDRTTVLTVGRFFKGGHNKRQDVAIDIVRTLQEQFGRSVKLQMVGALHANAQSRDRFNELVQLAQGLDCEFFPNASRERLLDLYSHAAVLIHAAGFGVDRYAYPERLEHFGIVPVEAASRGAIPVVYGEAGPAEVLELLECPTTFRSVREAAAKIDGLFADPDRAAALSTQLVKRSEMFSSEAFRSRVYEALAAVL